MDSKNKYYISSKDKQKAKLRASLIVISILYVICIIGLQHPDLNEWFLPNYPILVILSLAILFFNRSRWDIRYIIYLIFTFFATYFIVLYNLNTGKVFGDLIFGSTLGWKLSGVPVIIGAFWLMMILSVGFTLKTFKANALVRFLLGAVVLTLLDLLIEQVALKFDFWHWNNEKGLPSNQNFAAWFFISFGLLFYFNSIRFKLRNKMGIYLFLANLGFFLFFDLF